MGLSDIFTNLCGCGTNGAKSPPVPKSPSPDAESENARPSAIETKASENASDKTIVEVMPCGDVTNAAASPMTPKRAADGSKLDTHAVGFGVNQILKQEDDAVKEVADDNNLFQKTILDVFGAQIHKGINAKAWDERTLALAAVRTKCENKNIPQGISNSQFLDGCCKFVIVCIQDKVMPVYFDGLDLMKYMLGEFFANYPEANDVVRDNLEHMLPLLIAKSADRNARSLEATRLTLTFLARCPCVGAQPIMAHMFASVQNHKEVAAIRGRLDLINNLIDEFGFGKAGTITMQLVMGFVRPHLDATDEKVRRAAVEVTVNCYKHKGDRTLKYVTNVKPALLKLLQQRFEELGKPSKARKQVRSAQGLAPVRGRGKKPMAKRESTSQPVGVAPQAQAGNGTLGEWPSQLSMGGSFGVPMASPGSQTAERSPQQLPGCIGGEMQGLSMGNPIDSDDDLMNEIEAACPQ
jgi:hypothetical protein